ncbi:MAG: phosphatidate cytidylyltransferase [Candidatus Methylumidiphilus alinenensis]|uniref:Phosphatidate cytidylyltransferase n=1 Tax=Candidatus Methylumidiphilus alinenensis TaxID=2202197 RepID=A0A2W4R5J1_9GAMM|nr:MAG: phosphatidate cytidylyltransferase [Candidatus Methylumidiphilus alinenensis]
MLKNRILTALVLAPLAIAGILYLPDRWFALLWGVAIAVCAWEWSNLAGLTTIPTRAGFLTVCVGFMTSFQQWAGEMELWEWLAWPMVAFWFVLSILLREMPTKLLVIKYPIAVKLLVGFFVLVSAWILMVWTRINLGGSAQVLYLFMLVWVADIAAYFVGKRWGLTKLAPEISPGKTAEGLYGALVVIVLFSLAVAAVLYQTESGSFISFSWVKLGYFILLSVVTVLFSVVGDLFESLVKRVGGVKDSGAILPGHGGFLDRLDSLIAAVSVFYAGSKLLEIYFQ